MHVLRGLVLARVEEAGAAKLAGGGPLVEARPDRAGTAKLAVQLGDGHLGAGATGGFRSVALGFESVVGRSHPHAFRSSHRADADQEPLVA